MWKRNRKCIFFFIEYISKVGINGDRHCYTVTKHYIFIVITSICYYNSFEC